MSIRNQVCTFLLSLLVIGFLFLSIPEKGFAGLANLTCCQVAPDECFDLTIDGPLCLVEDGRPGSCNEEVGLCQVGTAIPTLNEWGLITVAIALGIVGFAFYRRRKASV